MHVPAVLWRVIARLRRWVRRLMGRPDLNNLPRPWTDAEAFESLFKLVESERITKGLVAVPDRITLRALVDAVFWMSLEEEEGRPVLPAIVYAPPRALKSAMILGDP